MPSRIAGAGEGLFAFERGEPEGKVIFKRGETITPYEGERMTRANLEAACPGDKLAAYAVEANTRGDVINAPKSTDGYARFANDPAYRGPDERYLSKASAKPNAELKVHGGRVRIVAEKPIRNKQEIMVMYGRGYWRK
jgi:hypothetical protein